MSIIKTKRISLYCEGSAVDKTEQREKQRLLFISGTGGDLRVKPNMMDGPLAEAFDLIAYDQRGLGQSDKPKGPYSMEDYADDAASLMDAVGWDNAHVVGVSFGGMVAQHLALRHPGRINKLVLACTSSGGEGGASFPFHELDGIEGAAYFRKITPISDLRLSEAWQKENPDKFQTIIDNSVAMRAHIPVTEDSKRGARLQLEARMHHDTYAQLKNIDLPVYLCGGKYDGICPQENMLAIHEQIKNSTIKFFEGGHLFLVQDKTANQAICSFLLNSQ